MSTVACKICESEIPVDKLLDHSTQCKQVTELKEQLFQFTQTMESYAEKSNALKNRLETYAMKQKKLMKKTTIIGSLNGLEPDSPRLTADSWTDGASAKFDVPDLDLSIMEEDKNDEKCLLTRTFTGDRQDFLDLKKMADEDQDKLITEAKKSVFALKKIATYAAKTSSGAQGNDMDFDVKNELEVIYDDIADPKISSFLKSFMDDLEKYIDLKKQYAKESAKLVGITSHDPYKHLKQAFQINKARSSKHVRGLFVKTPKSQFKEDAGFGGQESPIPITKANTLKSFSDFGLLKSDSKSGSTSTSGSETKDLLQPPRILSSTITSSPGQVINKSRFSGARTIKKESDEILEKPVEQKPVEIKPVVIAQPQQQEEVKESQVISEVEHMQRVAKYREQTKSRKNRSTVSTTKALQESPKLKPSANNNLQENFQLKEWGPVIVEQNEEKENSKKPNNKTPQKKVKRSTSMELDKPTCMELELDVKVNLKMLSPGLKIDKILSPGLKKGLKGKTEENYPLEKKPSENSPHLWESPMMRGYHSDDTSNTTKKRRTILIQEEKQVSIEDFDPIRFIGKGAYGTVWLVRKKATGDEYAMKIVDWEDRNKQNRLAALKLERDIYKMIEGDYVVKAVWTFHHDNFICFVTEYMIGGDFSKLLDQLGRFEEDQARFYFAELVLAIESLHTLGIVHRDLKPDNILMDARGHIRLTDFGLSRSGMNKARGRRGSFLVKEISDDYNLQKKTSFFDAWVKDMDYPVKDDHIEFKKKKVGDQIFDFLKDDPLERKSSKFKGSENKLTKKKSMVGTPDYMAPEVINPDLIGSEGEYNEKVIDWWSMGVILYQLLIGVPPFCGDSVEKVFDNVQNYRIDWPSIGYDEDCITPEAVDLISKLLNPNPNQRLGSHGTQEVKNHPFFKGFDWKDIREKDGLIIPCATEMDSPEGSVSNTDLKDEYSKAEFPLSGGNSIKSSSSNRQIEQMNLDNFKMTRLDVLDKLNKETYKRLQTIKLEGNKEES